MKLPSNLDKIGLAGLFLTALASPCCFPLFGFLLALFGFGSFELFGNWTMYVFLGLVLLSLAGTFFSYRRHKNFIPLIIGGLSAMLIFYAYYFEEGYLFFCGSNFAGRNVCCRRLGWSKCNCVSCSAARHN